MTNFIELNTKTYMSKDFKEFMDKSGFDGSNESMYNEGDEWKRKVAELESQDVELPKYHIVKVYIDPTKIVAYFESFSMEEAYLNPENPKKDMVDIQMLDGVQVSAICSIEEFNKKLQEYYKRINKIK